MFFCSHRSGSGFWSNAKSGGSTKPICQSLFITGVSNEPHCKLLRPGSQQHVWVGAWGIKYLPRKEGGGLNVGRQWWVLSEPSFLRSVAYFPYPLFLLNEVLYKQNKIFWLIRFLNSLHISSLLKVSLSLNLNVF